MIVMGLNFGHDASVCIVQDGKILVNISRERHVRVKHAMQIRPREIDLALSDAGISFEDLDYCAVTTSQGNPYTFFKGDELTIEYSPDANSPIPTSKLLAADWPQRSRVLRETSAQLAALFSTRVKEHDATRSVFIDPVDGISHCLSTTETYINYSHWQKFTPLDQIPKKLSSRYFSELSNIEHRSAYHFPATVTLRGHKIPAAICSHHSAHAASTFYLSGYDDAAIMSVDGATPNSPGSYKGGMFYVGIGTRLVAIWPHGLGLGGLYRSATAHAGLGSHFGEGKFMGLAPYGRPAFMDHRYIGCIQTVLDNLRITADFLDAKVVPQDQWIAECNERARASGYDMEPLGDPSRVTEPVNADFAASTQMLFEETLLYAARQLADCCAHLGMRTSNLCLAGGTMLNCPANSRLANESPFENIFIVPGCDDSGLAIGAALYLMHNVLDLPRAVQESATTNSAYLGRAINRLEIETALEASRDRVEITPVEDASLDAARGLAANKVIAWFEGRSEFGPRALGHRSLLADPRGADNWSRVNMIKNREKWRPFAPAVLEEEQERWFARCPSPSPFMMFTGQVRGADLPAITHLDGSSRIQSVAKNGGGYRRLIEGFFTETNCPVVLNTSLNGPREPIVESPMEALSFLDTSDADALYFEGFRITRRKSPRN